MYRLFVISRHTFFEAAVQPIYSLLLTFGAGVLIVFGVLPFFTLGEDTVMYKSVSLDVILLFVLIATLFATSRSIYEEIEDRTMLTLMSKPIRRWEVLVGKYLGIITAALLAVAALGVILVIATWLRIPNDYLLRAATLDDREASQLRDYRLMHLAGLLPSLVLVWLQVSVLAAVGVALSTRFSLVVNLPTVILLYVAGNLTRFLNPDEAMPGRSVVVKGFAWVLSTLLPFLRVFDLRDKTVYSPIKIAGTMFEKNPSGVYLSSIWTYVAIAAAYGIAYVVFALSAGLWSFRTRELGGAEG
jgi:ABC-type transport system involved in multi-copper enzyme maturation permease subunit